jgi:mRNA interferase RelE/StbE
VYTVQFTKQAIKALRKISANEAALIRAKISELAVDPFAAPNVKKLAGRPGYRLRIGDWRVIYEVYEDELIIAILKIAPRGGAYQ